MSWARAWTSCRAASSYRALLAGFTGKDIVFGGVGKTEHEMGELSAPTCCCSTRSRRQELADPRTSPVRLGVAAPVSRLRVNPEVKVDTPHRYTKTGSKGQSSAFPSTRCLAVARRAAGCNTDLVGLDMHIGSQLFRLDAIPRRNGTASSCSTEIEGGAGHHPSYLDIGGGLGVSYEDDAVTSLPSEKRSASSLGGANATDYAAYGAGTLSGRKRGHALDARAVPEAQRGTNFLITDAGMTELLRPSHYDAYHRIEAVSRVSRARYGGRGRSRCARAAISLLDRQMDDVVRETLLISRRRRVRPSSMASNYNSGPRPRSAGGRIDRISRSSPAASDYEDLVRLEPAEAAVEGADARRNNGGQPRSRQSQSSCETDAGEGVSMVMHAGDYCSPFALSPISESGHSAVRRFRQERRRS